MDIDDYNRKSPTSLRAKYESITEKEKANKKEEKEEEFFSGCYVEPVKINS